MRAKDPTVENLKIGKALLKIWLRFQEQFKR